MPDVPKPTGPEPSGPPRPRRFLRIAGLVVAIVIPVVTVATIVIPIVVEAGERTSSPDTLVIDGDGTDSDAALAALSIQDVDSDAIYKIRPGAGFSVWLPTDAPLETFPVDAPAPEYGGCGQEQVDWLNKYRTINESASLLHEMRNTATSGATMSVTNVHVEGEFRDQDPARIWFSCNGGGAGSEPDFIVLNLTIGDESPATVEYDYRNGNQIPPGTIFSTDIAPGEYVQLFVDAQTLKPDQDFFGKVVADVEVGGEKSTVVLQEGWLWRSPPAVNEFTALWTTQTSADDYNSDLWNDPTAWHLMCVHQTFAPGTDFADQFSPASAATQEFSRCTPAEFAEQARSARREF